MTGGLFLVLVGLAGCALSTGYQVSHYPAGIDPRLCPNYPQCDNAILAAFSKNPLPFMDKEGGRPQQFDHFFFTKPGYPVGLSPIQCPNYPFCH